MAHAIAPGTTIDRIPRPIRQSLGWIDRRLRLASAFRGFGTTALIGAQGALLGMVADVMWVLPQQVRWMLWGVWVIVVSGLMLRALARILGRRNGDGLLGLAAVVERAFPDLEERLTGIVGLVGDRPNGSSELIAASAKDAAESLAGIQPSQAVPVAKAARRFGLGIAVFVIVGAPAILRPDPFGTIARRFLMPWLDIERVGRLALHVTPGDSVVGLGDDLSIAAEITPRLGFGKRPDAGEVWVEWKDAGTGRLRRVAMEDGSVELSRSFVAALPNVTGELKYRVAVDRSDESRWFRVETVPPPSVAKILAKVEPPGYMKLPTTTARDPDRIEAWEGSQVLLTVAGSSPLRSLDVSWPGQKDKISGALEADGKSSTVTLTAQATGDYALNLLDTHGLTSRSEPRRRVIVRPDAPPTVALGGMEGLDEARTDDTLRVDIKTSDDFGVVSVELHYRLERTTASSLPNFGKLTPAITGLGAPVARGEAVLALEKLGLLPGDSLAYRVRVTDNRPEPHVVWSQERRLTMVAEADPLASRRRQADRVHLQEKLDTLKKTATNNRRETEPLRYAADAAHRGNGQWDDEHKQALAKRESEARAVVDGLQEFARELADDPLFHPLARPARQAAEVEAEAARKTLDQARVAPDDAKRLADLRLADARLGGVSERLEELQRNLDALVRRDLDRQKLDQLADRQSKVVDQLDKLESNTHDRARIDRVRAEQDKVKNELDNLVKNSPDLRAELLASSIKEAGDLAKRAHDLADRQRQQARQATDLTKAEKIAALQRLADDQRAIETEARKLALDVDQPLSEAGRSRVNTEVIRRPAEPIERGEIVEGRQRLQEAEHDLRRLVRDLEDAPIDVKLLARRLAQRQDQLTNAIIQALGANRSKADVPADERAEFLEMLKPLVRRQEAITKLATAIDPKIEPGELRDTIEKARQSATRAREALRDGKDPRALEARAVESRDALNRLANEAPDPWKRTEPARKKLDEARQVQGNLIRDIETHLRETDKPNDPTRGLTDLANRLGPLAERARDAAGKLDAMKPSARVEPQRNQAANGAKALAKAIETARDEGSKASGFEPSKVKATREALAKSAVEARVAFERLEQKMNDQVPADDLAHELLEDERALRDQPVPKSPLERLQRLEDQRRLASALRNVQAPDAVAEQLEAIRLAEAAARALANEPANPEKDKAAIEGAVKAMETLAKRLGGDRPAPADRPEGPRDPELEIHPEHASRARDLALRERRLRERLQAVLGEEVAPQDEIRRESVAIGEKLAEIRDRAQGVSVRGRGPADEASKMLAEHAPRAMEEAEARLAQGDPNPARDLQRRAADQVEHGARLADDLAAALRAEKGAAAASGAENDTPGPLASAREAMARAGEKLADSSRQAARQSMKTAADQLRAAASKPSREGPPAMADGGTAKGQPANGEPESSSAGVAPAAELRELKELVRTKTGRSWGELPGHLRTEILQMSQGRYRDDYSRLIQLYFREIAAGEPRK